MKPFRSHKRGSRSLFFHLVFVLVSATVVIHIAVISFAFFSERSSPDSTIEKNIRMYATLLSESFGHPPDPEKARKLARSLSLQVAFRGKERSWETDPGLLSQRTGHHDRSFERTKQGFVYRLKTEDGEFLFFIAKERRFHPALVTLLSLLTVILFIAWWTLRRILHPVEQLESAFERVASGNLDERLVLRHPREFVKAADGFNAMVDRIKEMIVSRETMLHDVSHELRSPIARMKLSLQFLPETEERSSLEEDLRELEALIGTILETARYSGESEASLQAVDPIEAARRAVASVGKLHPDVIFQLEVPESPVFYRGDREGLVRVLQNLLENGARYAGSAPISVSIGSDGSSLRITVSDGGPGIPPELHSKIFEPFYQIDRSRTPGRDGYGLGLYLCRKIVKRQHGTIEIQSNGRGGSDFTVRFPLIGAGEDSVAPDGR